MSDPRVLMVTGEYPPLRGGVADYSAMLSRALSDCGVATHILSARGAEGDNVTTVRSWNWPVALHIRELVRRQPVDVVHIQYQAGAFDMHTAINALPTVLSAWLRLPVVTTFHDLRVPYLFPKAGRLRSTVMLRMARSSKRAIVTNPGDQRVLTKARIDPLRIPLGPSLPTPSASSQLNDAPQIGFFGFPSHEKGISVLLEAIGMFSQDERPALTVVGATRPDAGTHHYLTGDEVDRMADDAGVTLRRTGYLPQPEASDTLASCNVIGLPFVHGANQRSSALVAALRLDRPVVTTAIDLRDDLDTLADMQQLITVPPRDPRALHDALRFAIEHDSEPDPLPEQYTWRAIAAKHRELYEWLIDDGNT